MSLSRKVLIAALVSAIATLLAGSWVYYNLTLVEGNLHRLSEYTLPQALTAGEFDVDAQRAVGNLDVATNLLPFMEDNTTARATMLNTYAAATAAVDAAQLDLDALDLLEARVATEGQYATTPEQIRLQQERVLLLIDMRTKLLAGLNVGEANPPTEVNSQALQAMLQELRGAADTISEDSAILTIRDVNAVTVQVEQQLAATDISVIISFVLVAALVVVGPFLMQRFVVNPLRQLSTAAHAVTHGDLHQQVPETHNDEIGELQQSFNLMVASLRDQQTTLNERKAELEQERHALATALDDVQRLSDERTSLLERTVERLSAPVLPVLSGVLVMPVIGSVDDRRAALLQRTLLEQIAEQHAQLAIIDLTGLNSGDTLLAHALVELVQGARLLGAQPVIVGVAPRLAAALVSEGMQTYNVVTMPDLQAAVLYAIGKQPAAVRGNGNGNGSTPHAAPNTIANSRNER